MSISGKQNDYHESMTSSISLPMEVAFVEYIAWAISRRYFVVEVALVLAQASGGSKSEIKLNKANMIKENEKKLCKP